MNHRHLISVGLLALGLLLGILIGRWLMPDRYGLVTMILLVNGGIVVGALLMGGWTWRAKQNAPRAADAAAQTGWRITLGATRIAVRYDATWRQRARTNWRARFARRAGKVSWLAVGCLFGAVGLALYAQLAFTNDKTFSNGAYAYLFAALGFGALVWALDSDAPDPKRVPSAIKDSPRASRIRLAMIVLAALGAAIAAFVGATTVWNAPQTANIILWLGACALYGSAFVPWRAIVARLRTDAGRSLRAFGQRLWRQRVELFLLGVIMAVAFVARYWRLAWIPGIFGGDEGEMGAEALAVLNGQLQNPFITGWLSHGTLYFFVQSFALHFLGPTIFGLRLSSVLAGTLSVLLAYLLIRRLFSVRLALLTAALLAAFDFHIHFSRIALNNIFDAVFAPFVLLLLYVGVESRRAVYFALAGMAMGLALYFYHGARLIPLVVIVFGIYLLLTQRDAVIKNLENFGWLALGALIVAGPLLYFFYLHPNDFMARLAQRGIFQSGWFEKQIESGKTGAAVMLEQVRRSFSAFNALPDPTNWFGTGLPLLDPLSGMFFVFGIVYSLFQWRKKNYALMFIWLFLGVFFGSTLLENPPTSPSFIIVTIPALFFVACGLDKLFELAAQVLRPLARVRHWAVAALVLLIAAWGLAFYFIAYTPRYAYGGEPNWVIGAMTQYLQSRQDRYRVYFVAPPYIYLNIGSRKFLMPQLRGQDVVEPIASAKDLAFVQPARPALFVFVPAREQELPIVQAAFPGGTVRRFDKPDGKLLFIIYQVNTP